MKILYDPQIFSTQKYGGISNYFVQIISGVMQYGNDVCLPLWFTENEYIHENIILKNELINKNYLKKPNGKPLFNTFRGKRAITRALAKIGLTNYNEKYCINYLKKGDFDLLHPTYYNPYFYQYLEGKPFVLTIYDMTHELYPDNFVSSKTSINKKYLAQKASKIIAISESTKRDAVKILGIEPDKIKVIHLASSFNVSARKTDISLPEKYILFTGQRGGFKNFNRFICACAPVIKNTDISVVCTYVKFTDEELGLFDKLQIKERMIHYPANNEILQILYSNALFFIFPSLNEGFGLPVLEAFSCGCPVVLSDRSSFPEVAGTAGIYFDPTNEDSIRAVINQVLQDKELRRNMVQAGYEQQKLFTWEKTIQDTVKLYNTVINNNVANVE